jgi:hypothetical protein
MNALNMAASRRFILSEPTIITIYTAVNLYNFKFPLPQSHDPELEWEDQRNAETSASATVMLSPLPDHILNSQSSRPWSWHYWARVFESWQKWLLLWITKACVALIILSLMIIMISLILAIWWSVTRNDIQGGCTLGGYMVSISAIIVGIAGLLHRPKCKCWIS